jgi:hypothetical protein
MSELHRWLLLTLAAAVIGVLMPLDVSRSVPVAYALGPLLTLIAPALVTAVGGLITGVASTKIASNASKKAQSAQAAANDRALEWERERDERARRDAERVERENAQRWQDEVLREQRNMDRAFAEDTFRDRRLDPYREAGREAVADLSSRSKNAMRDLPGLGRI